VAIAAARADGYNFSAYDIVLPDTGAIAMLSARIERRKS
jgi:hypothetical protein